MSDDNAIQNTDVLNETEEEQVINPRLEAMERISQTRKQQMTDEDGIIFENEEEETSLEDKDTDSETVGEEKEEETPTYKVKIEGEELEVDAEELIRGYQKDATASRRLDEAARARTELEERERLLREKEEELSNRLLEATKEDGVKQEEEEEEDPIVPEELAKSIREGEDDEAAKAIEKLLKKASKKKDPTITKEEIADLVESTLKREREEQEKESQRKEMDRIRQEMVEAEEKFKEDFDKEMKENDDFFDVAILQDNRLQKDPEWSLKPFTERFEEAGKRAKKMLGMEKEEEVKKQKQEKKKDIDNLKGSTATDNIAEEEQTMSASDIINAMKKSRGQVI